MKTITTALLFLIALTSAAQRTFIYRNDAKFTRFNSAATFSHEGNIESGFAVTANGETIPVGAVDSIVFRPIDIPTIYIETPDTPQLKELESKEEYLNAYIHVEGNGFIDDFEGASGRIKGRGNSTWNFAKKPYRIKFDKKQSIGGFVKAKNYVLLANFADPTKIKNMLVFWLANRLGIEFSNTMIPCDVVFNGIWKGSYTMTQKVGISPESVNIDENRGILFELSVEYDEDYKFKSPVYQLPVMVKDPDFSDLEQTDPSISAQERLRLWQDDFSIAERAADNGDGFSYFDMNSFIDYILVNDFVANSEIGYPKSVYIYKEGLGNGEKYKFGPLWDFDIAFNIDRMDNGEINSEVIDPNKSIWLNPLFVSLSSDPNFEAAYKVRVKELIEDILPEFMKQIDIYASLVEPSAKTDGLIWGDNNLNWIYAHSSFDYKNHIEKLRSWVTRRSQYLKSKYL